MAIELYWGSGSPFAWRVMLTLELKRLPYESKLLEFSKQEHKTPAYLQLNPRGKVPTLKDGDFVLYESIAIMAYLDRKYPTPPIFGTTAEQTGLIWRSVLECESYLLSAGDKVVRPLFFGKGLENVNEIQAAADVIRRELKMVNERLADSNWLVGGEISAADIAIFPLVQLLLRAAGKEAARPLDLGLIPLSKSFPNIARWVRRIEELPNYQRTYPPHWKE
ncbi:MAG TPA: glutathione S-transferase family protein [Candidatus Binatia bacterium]|jgi:glutathione S-transferase|nr:glutathione S-transferase family protein [Candidatus Binatia bacterium]